MVVLLSVAVCLCVVYVARAQQPKSTRLLGNVSVAWDSDSFHVNVTRGSRQFRFSLFSDAGVLTLRSDLANSTADSQGFGFPWCAIKDMRCLTGPLDIVASVHALFFQPPLIVLESGNNFTVTARVSQQGTQLVNATVTLYYFAQPTVVGIRRLDALDVKFDFQVDLPAWPQCTWQLSTGWPGSTVAVVDQREQPAAGPLPEQQPDEVFSVSSTGGRLRWACAQFARTLLGGALVWGRVETSAGENTIWMKFYNSSGATSVFIDTTLSVLLQPYDLSLISALLIPHTTTSLDRSLREDSMSIPFIAPPDYDIDIPGLLYTPTEAEMGVGYASVALFAILLISCVVLFVVEALDKTAKRKEALVSPFLIVAGSFCLVRVAQIACQLSVGLVYANMLSSIVLESVGNVLFLSAFTLIAIMWVNLLLDSRLMMNHMKRLRVALIVGLVIVSVLLFAFMVWETVSLGDRFGRQAHDGSMVGPFGPNNTLARVPVRPVNNTMTKPFTGIIMANLNLHNALMAEKGSYAIYGFLLGITFALLSLVIIGSLLSNTSLKDKQKARIRTRVFRILFVSAPVALCFSVIFIFTVIEIALHRHGQRHELYITQFLASEIVAVIVLLFHYWSSNLRSYARGRVKRSRMPSTNSTMESAKSDAIQTVDVHGSETARSTAADWENSGLPL